MLLDTASACKASRPPYKACYCTPVSLTLPEASHDIDSLTKGVGAVSDTDDPGTSIADVLQEPLIAGWDSDETDW